MGISPEQYAALKNASEHFLAEEDFSYPHTTELMKTVFGSNCASPEALAWAKYWTNLGDADEKIQAGQKAMLPKLPPMCTQAGSSNGAMEDRDIKMPNSQPTLSNASLGSDRVDEPARRKANGNIHSKEKKDIGWGFNDLMASGVILHAATTPGSVTHPICWHARLIVCCVLAFPLCDNSFFIDFCNVMCPGYSVPNHSNFISYNLVMEAENAMKHLQELLESFIYLTMSFDGWSSRRNDEIYTLHISTPTCLSTMGETIFENLKNVGVLNISFHQTSPHQVADIMVGSKTHPKINGFAEVMKIVSKITTYFSHSNYGKKHLKDKLKEQDDKRGLISFGAPRFSTFADQSSSKCYSEGLLVFDTKVTKPLRKYFMTDSPEQLQL
ncbi:hypothetical protein B0H14DRAFT_2565108 [Mycena olivaceomarginata]|nr:hypothetical protein B0H14DRAFT_2565108 [Mycena olivaceomarginata]